MQLTPKQLVQWASHPRFIGVSIYPGEVYVSLNPKRHNDLAETHTYTVSDIERLIAFCTKEGITVKDYRTSSPWDHIGITI